MIWKSNKRASRVRFEITNMISDENCTTRGSITAVLKSPKYRTWSVQIFYWWSTNRFKIKLIHFLGGKNKSFGNKSCKICYMILFVFHFPAIWWVTLNKPWNLIGCFVFSVASLLAGKKMRLKAKNSAIRELIAPISANKITGTTIDVKMGVIKN